MRCFSRALLLGLVFTATSLRALPDDISFEDFEDPPKPSPAKVTAPPKAAPARQPSSASAESPTLSTSAEGPKRWYVIVPAFVIHGFAPTNGANTLMPRRLSANGRFVGTPGIGIEYLGRSSFEFAAAFVKDCYDNAAGALQIGQHWRVGQAFELGYSVGVYIRETPIQCLTQVTTTTTSGGLGQPRRINTLTTTTCAFEDNLPLRYTFRSGSGYVDVIPTPFVHAAARVLRWPTDIYLKAISNFYLNEIGLSIPF